MTPIATATALSARNRRYRVGAAIFLLLTACASAAEEIRIGGSGTAIGTLGLLADAFAKQSPDFRAKLVPNLGSSGGIKALAAGAIDLAGMSRPMKADEQALGLKEIEYGRTPFVFAVAAQSRVTAISLRELAEIYAGKKASWADGSPIRIVLRPAGDIDTEIVKGMSPALGQALMAAQQRRGVAFAMTDQDAANDLEKIAGAIGPTSLALLISEKRALRVLKLDGVEPTPRTIETGAYPHYKRLFVVTGAKQPESVPHFIAFIQSPAGRKILAQTGHWVP